jgi:hypothetical protein
MSSGLNTIFILNTNPNPNPNPYNLYKIKYICRIKRMANVYPPPPYGQRKCPAPPYNATNFTPQNTEVFSTLVSYAKTSPNYPWATGTDAQQIYRSNQNVSYFTHLNQKTQSIKTANGASGNIPYPQFRSEAERLMYIQGKSLTASRNQITGVNPSEPAGVPCSTIYGIINS